MGKLVWQKRMPRRAIRDFEKSGCIKMEQRYRYKGGKSLFETDNALLNRIHENTVWSFKSNNFTFPFDCPQRDERVNCAFDFYNAHAVGLYLYDICSFCEEWLVSELEMHSYQDTPATMTYRAIYLTLLWELYVIYGNRACIEDNYEAAKRFFENRYLKYYPTLNGKDSFGDWAIPHIPGDFLTSFSSTKEIELYAAVKAVEALANMAELLSKEDDFVRYSRLRQEGIQLYNERFYNPLAKRYSDGKQTPNIVALANGYAPEAERRAIEQNLLDSIRANGNRLDVGTWGARLFLECLSDLKEMDTALDCFTSDEFPSFKYEIDHGATTLWEQWFEYGGMDSHNHQMFGGAMTGFYTRIAGITALEPGYRVIGIKPNLTKHVHQLKTVVATVCGDVHVEWCKHENTFEMSLKIPANCTALVTLPNGQMHQLANGEYHFSCVV